MNKKRVVVLPIQEPWASMIASGEKRFEFRGWEPKWEIGQEIWIVATGKAPMPRQVIAYAKYGGAFFVRMNPHDGEVFIDKNTLVSPKLINKWGGRLGDVALKLDKVKRFNPFELKKIGIMRTPQKYQYHTIDTKVTVKDSKGEVLMETYDDVKAMTEYGFEPYLTFTYKKEKQ